jgi:hypothetical protein
LVEVAFVAVKFVANWFVLVVLVPVAFVQVRPPVTISLAAVRLVNLAFVAKRFVEVVFVPVAFVQVSAVGLKLVTFIEVNVAFVPWKLAESTVPLA